MLSSAHPRTFSSYDMAICKSVLPIYRPIDATSPAATSTRYFEGYLSILALRAGSDPSATGVSVDSMDDEVHGRVCTPRTAGVVWVKVAMSEGESRM